MKVQKITVINDKGAEIETDFQETSLEYRIRRVKAILKQMEKSYEDSKITVYCSWYDIWIKKQTIIFFILL